jgi:GTP-binding protein
MGFAPIVPVSAADGSGVPELLNMAIRVYAQLNRRIDTGPLNQALEKWLEEYPTPIGPQTRFKVKYTVQVSANPVKFIFFVSRVKAVSDAYIAYLRNKIRKDLGFSLIPVVVELRASQKEGTAGKKQGHENQRSTLDKHHDSKNRVGAKKHPDSKASLNRGDDSGKRQGAGKQRPTSEKRPASTKRGGGASKRK